MRDALFEGVRLSRLPLRLFRAHKDPSARDLSASVAVRRDAYTPCVSRLAKNLGGLHSVDRVEMASSAPGLREQRCRIMDARQRRLAKNEVMFRDLNERVARIADTHSDGDDADIYEFLCECSNPDCTLRVSLTIAAYEVVRADPTQFVVAPGHELPEIEDVVVRQRGYQIVRKSGAAARFAKETNPHRGQGK